MQFSEYKNEPPRVIPNGSADPFNFPMPGRTDCMSLNTISAGKDNMKTTTVKFSSMRSTSQNLNQKDIEGAIPKLHGSKPVGENKMQFNLQNHDIERSNPRTLHIGLQKPENNLKTNDIFGCKPQCVKFETTRIGQNPLNPSYNLQSVEYLEAEPVKFIRDQQYIDDIPGSRPAKKKQLDIGTRDIMQIKDIEGTQAKQHTFSRVENKNYNAMDYRDVTNVDFKTTRTTNPLEPTYIIRDETNNMQICEIGRVAGSQPNVLPPARTDMNFVAKSLKTEDILGCSIGTKNHGSFHTRERRGYKNTNITTDIIGAQPGTLKKSPDTKRQTHPLDPNYQMPGRMELTNINDCFGKRNAVQQSILDRHAARNDKPVGSTFQASAQQSLGIKEVSSLHSASRKGSDAPAAVAASAKGSERSMAQISAAAQSNRSNAQKLDSFIK